MDAERILASLGVGTEARWEMGGFWVERLPGDLRGIARTLAEHELRLITITARHAAGGYRIIYHWNAADGVVNFATSVPVGGSVPSITDLVPGADWAEREIHDYYGLTFTGRTDTRPLVLREGDPAGLFAHTTELARDADPAVTARRAAQAPKDATVGATEQASTNTTSSQEGAK